MTGRETRVIRVDVAATVLDLSEAGRICREGGLVAFPTETVYGLGTNALDPEAVARLAAAKRRPPGQAFSVMVSRIADALPLVAELPEGARTLMEAFLPGPLTVIVPASESVPDLITGGSGKVGIRVPDHAVAQAFLVACGCPVAAPSANIHGQPSPRTAEDVLAQLGGAVDIIVDGGPAGIGLPSSVIDMTSRPPTLLREGAIPAEGLESVLETTIVRA